MSALTPEAVAASLTAAQREALRSLRASNWPNRNWLIKNKLVLATGGMTGIMLTPLGRAVRALLQADPPVMSGGGVQGSGASVPDRAVVPSASSPAVSTVPASIPRAEYPPDCPSWYTVSLCGKCRKCERKLGAMASKAAPHSGLIATQSVKQCRICTRIERYCQTDGQGRGKHPFTPVMTCESCVHMGGRYWGSDDRPIHHCGKGNDRRRANFKISGDFSQDFMDEFRKFYDAGPYQSAECCSFFEARESASAMSAGTAETAQQAQGDSPPARAVGDAQIISPNPKD